MQARGAGPAGCGGHDPAGDDCPQGRPDDGPRLAEWLAADARHHRRQRHPLTAQRARRQAGRHRR